MTQRAEQAVTNRAPAAMIAGAIPLIDVSGHLAGDAEASPLAGFKAPADLNTLHVAVRRPQGQDIDGTTENFPKHDAAMAQGPNRFARAQFYLERGRA